MKRYQFSAVMALLGGVMAVTSCGDLNQSDVSGRSSVSPGGGGIEPEAWMSPGFSPAVVNRMPIGGNDFHVQHVGQATEAQRKLAAERAQMALSSSSTRQKLKAKNVKYVAVAVKRDRSQKASAGRTVMKVNVATGKPTGEVFSAKDQGGLKEGDTIKLGGDPTMYFAPAGDGL